MRDPISPSSAIRRQTPKSVATIGRVIARQPTTVCAIGKISAGYPCFRHDDTRD
jgi:hypothetical protein